MKKLFRRTLVLLLLCLSAFGAAALAERGKITFSLASGFYEYPMPLEITCDVSGARIYYTTDGSIPDETDTLYDGTITLLWTTEKDDPMSHRTGITLGDTYVPQMDFPSAHIIRAVAIMPEGTRSPVVSGTYFIGYNRQELYGDTALVFLAIDPSHLFDYDTGIYVTGRVYDEWVKDQTEAFESWQGTANYTQRGDAWERPVTVTFLPAEGEGFTQDMGVRIKGGASRGGNQKSLRLIARADYGEKNVKYELFPGNLKESDGKAVKKYKSFTLRNGGNDCDFGKIRDPFIQRLAEGMRFDTAANLPVIAFINGEYWGLYTLNEEYSDNYIDYHYGINNDNVVTVKVGEIDDGEEEDIALFDEMLNYIAYSDMSDPEKYAKACEMLDMGSFADYCALQLYIGNQDGPFQNNNWQMWRVRVPGEDDSPYADGKWRMMLYDTDFSSGIYNNGATFGEDNITPVLTTTDYKWRHPGLLFNSLIQSEEFLGEFVSAACDIRNLYFSKARAGALLDEMTDRYLPYQADTLLRFGPQWVTWNPTNHFSTHLKNIRTYFSGRYDRFLDILKQPFELSNPVTLTLKIEGEGTILINSREETPIEKTTSVKYFPEFGITVTAVPAEGRRFAGWTVSSSYGQVEDASAETTVFTFTRTVKLTAVFE
ncbi:MAG: CotH kinase family protein [Aristaeellaceae bacterium]